nr:uncharacterized protein CTRU02_14228 [Colletotrichum truncatum]KAF6782451.1 hypothetical protein CTRU02_14228 [Colletotrichum truncatum]
MSPPYILLLVSPLTFHFLPVSPPAFLHHVKIGDVKVSVRRVRDAATKAQILCVMGSFIMNGTKMAFIAM